MRLGLLFLALAISTCSFAQSQSILRAQAGYSIAPPGILAIEDSITHVHLNGRNSTITPTYLTTLYTQSGVYADDTLTTYDMKTCSCVVGRAYRKFNKSGLETEYNRLTPAGIVIWRRENTYNPAMQLEKTAWWSGSNPTGQTLYSYYNGKLVEQREDYWYGGILNPGDLDSFITSGSGSDSVHRFYEWKSGAWEEQYHNRYKRDAANRILVDSAFSHGQFEDVIYHLYDGQGRKVLDSGMSWDSQTSQLYFGGKTDYIYDAQSNLTCIKNWYWSGVYKLYSVDSFVYNSHNQVTSATQYDQTTGTWKATQSRLFYYEDVLNITEVATAKILQLYPIPAISYINISMSFIKPQPFSVRIFDMQGRLVNQWQEAAQQNYKKQMSLTSMAPGQYTLHIWAGDESVSRQFTLIR